MPDTSWIPCVPCAYHVSYHPSPTPHHTHMTRQAGPGSALCHVRRALLVGLITMDHHRRLGTPPYLATTPTAEPPSPAAFAATYPPSSSSSSSSPSSSSSSSSSSSFGHAMLHREGVWACAVCEVLPITLPAPCPAPRPLPSTPSPAPSPLPPAPAPCLSLPHNTLFLAF